MSDLTTQYEQAGLARRVGFGERPVVLVVDFIRGFTDPACPLGGDLTDEVGAARQVLDAARTAGIPVIFTAIVYDDPQARDAGLWLKKVPSLSWLGRGSAWVAVDERLERRLDERVIEKKFASAFAGTDLASYLTSLGRDTIILVGCTTSGCIRASAIDGLQHGFRVIVAREAVGDRAAGPHQANLFDIDAKYGDVVALDTVLQYLAVGAPTLKE
ncbi:MAG: isochorismatase family protein [Ardenticatenaceae bacterium]|nr:isochorismatase family protein [Ardenticatenaceae bacterium]